ncbi:MAG: Eco57I restriction-modification methylase domain-containing protein, partial [Porphyromonas sp.]|nr:Eco57I restriction-modification methylase domain-containing protein [Porphyromonas sp.]
MLGRIFESLLEDNKEKGAYYTPKEIVQYMCRESLIAYLCTGIDQGTPEHQAISEFVKSYDAELLTGVELEGVGLGTKVLERLKEVKVCDPAIGSGAFPMGMLRELYNCRISLEDLSVSSAEIKSQIIKSNIYGVDIEQGAVDIARLRFWLSLVVDETTPTPLPNLDYKIMQGNSLLEWYEGVDLSTLTQRKEDGCVELFDDLADVYRRQLRQAISAYYGETDHDRKATLHQEISEAIDEQLKEQHYTVDLSGINVSANTHFFLWHTWFDEVFNRPSGRNGFDIVIGNPPYIQLQNNGGELAKIYQGYGFKGFARTGDIYCLFYERGYQLLREGGHLCYITSNKWMRAGYGEKIRGFLADNTNPILLVDFAGIKVFEGATVDTNILLFSKEKNEGKTLSVSLTKDVQLGRGELCQYVQQHATPSAFTTSESWVILSPIEQSIKRKIEAVGKPLKDWDIQINYGIKTGCNEAFIIDEAKRAEILSNCQSDDERKRTEAIIRPILRGRDIRRYGYDWAGLYIVYIPWHFPLHLDPTITGASEKAEEAFKTSYPSVYNHLEGYKDILKKRNQAETGIRYEWYALQRWGANYWEEFEKPKIVWGEISDRSKFAYEARGGYMVEATTFLMVGCHLPLLFCMLNSLLLEWLFSKVGTTTGVGTVRWKKYTIEQLTLPLFSEIEIEFFARCVASYLDGTLSTSEFASNTNQKIYELLELTQD